MRKILSILFLVSVCTIARSQNLTFSQVLFYSGEISLTMQSGGTLYSVPQGKTWKVESLSVSQSNAMSFKLNGTIFRTQNMSYPIWLKEGDTIQVFVDNPSQYSGQFYMSIIEFSTI
jgi:hypothetical protein